MANETLSNLLHEERRSRRPPSSRRTPSLSAELYERAAADRLALLGGAGAAAQLGHAVERDARLERRRRSPSGSSAARSTSRTTASTGTSRPATATGSRIHWEGEPGDTRTITYAELQREVCKAANALTDARRRKPATGSRSTCR